MLREVANKHVLLMGDFNYPDIDWSTFMPCSSDPDTVDFVRTIEDCFYIQHVFSPTRGDAVLDLVLSTDPDLVSNVNVIDQLGNSDHNMITFNIHLACEVYVSKRKIKDYIGLRGDHESMRTVLADINWDNFMLAPVNDYWDHFKVLLFKLLDDYVPLKDIAAHKTARKPIWMTHKAFRLVQRKNKVFSKYKDTNHPAVKSARKAAKAEVKKARRN